MRSDLLAGVQVVDLTTDLAWDCGRMLASFGAEVVRIDTPKAVSALRGDADRTLTWQVGQSGKTCMTLDYEQPAGRALLEDLIARSDLVIESFTPGVMAGLGLGYDALSGRHPGVILVSITPFGQEGPYAQYKGGELVVAAMSSLIQVCGDVDRAPVREPLAAHLFHACAAGLTGAAIALHERGDSGRGQWVDISAQEVGASRNTYWIVAVQFEGRRPKRRGNYLNLGRTGQGNRTIWRLKDGFMAWQLMPPASPQTQAFAAWMDELGYGRPADASPMFAPGQAAVWETALSAFLADRTRAELMEESPRRGCDAAAISAPSELVGDPQFAAREFFGPPEPSLEGLRLPQFFIRTSSDTPKSVSVPVLAEV